MSLRSSESEAERHRPATTHERLIERPGQRLSVECADGLGPPPRWRIFADHAVDGLAQQIGVTGVSAVLLDQVAQQSAKTGVATIRRRKMNWLA